jgi:Zn-finger nucleic acid-binding protein
VRCPVCEDVSLSISSRDGVEIDFCPQCRGVWLDRGELDKILDRVAAVAPAPDPAPRRDDRERRDSRYDDRDRRDDRYDGDRRYGDDRRYEGDRRDDDRGRYDDRRYDERKYDKKRRKRSMLDDLFDVFD